MGSGVTPAQALPAPGEAATYLRSLAGTTPAKLAAAAVVLAVGVAASKYVVRLLGRPVARRFERESVAQTVLRTVRTAVVALAVAVAASILGFGAGDVLLSVTVFSAVLGIVLAPIVGNIVSGVFVLADQPYEIGDMVEMEDGTRGFVDDITIRYTKVLTLDNTFRVVPNGTIREQKVTNYSAEDQRTRLRLSVLVTYECDLDAARRLLERAARDCDAVIDGGPNIRIGAARYPAGPTAYLDEFADSGILITLRYWASQPYKLLTVRSRVQSRFWALMAEEQPDVDFAYPHQQLLVDEDDPLRVQAGTVDGATSLDGDLPADAERGHDPDAG
ncbi:MAG: small-conductance mechanosensitive channel [uncultured archaeon A07HB70]|nr:MAG: small-conductance mechanosensitive channel [uncultured archaeon A07HB70]